MPALEYSEWIDTITLILTVSGIVLGFIYFQILQNADDRVDLIASLRDGKVRRLYQGGVNWLLRGLQKLYGNKDSLQAFSVSFLLSYLYPFLFFILTYSYFDGTHLFSSEELLPADSPYRPYFFPGLVLFVLVMFWVLKLLLGNGRHIDTWGRGQLQCLGLSPGIADQLWLVLMGLLAGVVLYWVVGAIDWAVLGLLLGYVSGTSAVSFAISFTVAIVFAVFFVFAVSFGGAFADGGAFAASLGSIFGGTFGVVIVIACNVSFAVSLGGGSATVVAVVLTFACVFGAAVINGAQGAYNTSLMFAFFYLLLPSVNALLDWLSWWVSRFFLERTAQESRVRVIVLDVALDFGVAVLFMLALCLLLPVGAMLLDSLYTGWVDVKSGVPAQTSWGGNVMWARDGWWGKGIMVTPQTGWQEYAMWARDDPWGKGIMVTLMLVTTLIPTLLHILLGLMAFFIHGFKGAALADFLEKPRKNWRDAVASFWMFGYVVLAGAALWAMYQVFQHFAHLPIAQWLYHFTGYFYDLP